jgi:hypothetical protein
MNYFEFGTTVDVDWSRTETIYVKALTSSIAAKYLKQFADNEDGVEKDFVDFIYRCSVPGCCLPKNAIIYDSELQREYVGAFDFSFERANLDDAVSFLEWYVVEMNDVVVGSIGRNTLIEDNYHFAAIDNFGTGDRPVYNQRFTGYYDLDGAKERAIDYCLYLLDTDQQPKKVS